MLLEAEGSFFDEIVGFSVRKCKKTGLKANESTVFARAGSCNGRFWAMIVHPFGAGLRRSAGGARVRGGRRPQAHHGSLNRTPSPCD